MAGADRRSEIRSVGRYDLLAPIARGGMGHVYLARMRGIGGFSREVALKLVHDHLDSEQSQFDLLEEAKIAARLRHPNAVPVLDVGEDDGRMYIVMDYVEGDSLAGLTRTAVAETGSPMPLALSLRAIIDSLAGLHAAHELLSEEGAPLGLVHRDYSPQNVLVGADGISRLTDFGIAKLVARDSTRSGIVKGKIRYMSPQQARGEPLDRRCDVWAAGVVLWELFAGRKLFAADSDAATLLKIVNEKVPRLRDVAPDVHPSFDAIVDGCLQHDLVKRTSTAASLRKDLVRASREADVEAEQEDLAAFVNRCAGRRLGERRLQLAAAVRAAGPAPDLRRSRPEIARDDLPPPSVSGERPRSNPDPTPESWDGPTVADPKPPVPMPTRSVPVPPPSQPIARPASRPVAFPPENDTTSGHASLVSNDPFGGASRTNARPKRPYLAVGIASAVMAVVGLTLVVLALRRSPPAEPTAATSEPLAPTAPALPSTPSATSAAPATSAPMAAAAASASAAEAPAAKSRVVTFRSTHDVQRLRYGDTSIAIAPARSIVVLAITSDEDLPIEATAVDGRVTTTTLPAGSTNVSLAFGSGAKIGAGGGRSDGLAPSPYKGRK